MENLMRTPFDDGQTTGRTTTMNRIHSPATCIGLKSRDFKDLNCRYSSMAVIDCVIRNEQIKVDFLFRGKMSSTIDINVRYYC